MSQMSFLQSNESSLTMIQNKIILLYFAKKMDLPLTKSQIEKFALEEDFMDTLTVQTYIAELEASGYLEKILDNDSARFTLTEEGLLTIDIFFKDIPAPAKNRVMRYVSANRNIVKQDFQTIANYFFDHKNNEYIVKCAIYDDETMLMDLNLSVVSKEQAIMVCSNWRANVDELYSRIIELMFSRERAEAAVPAPVSEPAAKAAL